MSIEATELRDAIAATIRSFAGQFRQMTDLQLVEPPHPEYLTTSWLAFKLHAYGADHHPALKLTVRCEERTREVSLKSEFRAFLQEHIGYWKRKREMQAAEPRGVRGWKGRRQKLMRAGREANRKGKVDMTFYTDGHAFAVVENKGEIYFTPGWQLAPASRDVVIADLDRNAHYVKEGGDVGGVEFAAFTFYVADLVSHTIADGDRFRANIRRAMEAHLVQLSLDPLIKTNVLVESWDNTLWLTPEAGKLAQWEGDTDDRGHVAYGVVTMYRVGNDITDGLQLSYGRVTP